MAHTRIIRKRVEAETARTDLDAFLHPKRYSRMGYSAKALDGFRVRAEPDDRPQATG